MAEWIKTDGTKQTVGPKADYFSNTELHDMVGGSLTGFTLTSDEQGLFMFLDGDSLAAGKRVNQAATTLLHQYRSDLSHIQVYGDVVVAGLAETEDE